MTTDASVSLHLAISRRPRFDFSDKDAELRSYESLGDPVKLLPLKLARDEAPGEVVEISGKLYKQYRGMGSLAAMKAGSAARYGHEKNPALKVAPEGVEALKEACGSVDRVLAQLIGGIQSGMGYLGAKNLEQLRSKARYIRVSPAGQREAAPHVVVELKTGN